jgi:hypothetical protein
MHLVDLLDHQWFFLKGGKPPLGSGHLYPSLALTTWFSLARLDLINMHDTLVLMCHGFAFAVHMFRAVLLDSGGRADVSLKDVSDFVCQVGSRSPERAIEEPFLHSPEKSASLTRTKQMEHTLLM